MATRIEDLRILLLQARTSEDILLQEQRCFTERTLLPIENFHCHNLVESPPTLSMLDGKDALMIGGAGEYSMAEDFSFTKDLIALVQEVYRRRLPTFGTCWGHQVIARALGGWVIYDPELAELGCVDIQLTDEGKDDPLYADFPNQFLANAGHQDRVVDLPPGAVELAFNDSQRNQSFRMGDAPMYGTQFHSELDKERERQRLITYRDHYRAVLPDEEAFQAVIDSLRVTMEVDHLMHAFLTTIVLDKQAA